MYADNSFKKIVAFLRQASGLRMYLKTFLICTYVHMFTNTKSVSTYRVGQKTWHFTFVHIFANY